MNKTILALAALGLMSAFTAKAGDVPPEKFAHLTALITSDSEKARSFVRMLLQDIGDSSGVGDCSVFVKKTVGGNSYLVAKVVLETNGVQAIWRAVIPADFSTFDVVPEPVWQDIVKKGDDAPLKARLLDPNS
jgi:hypothetical protein